MTIFKVLSSTAQPICESSLCLTYFLDCLFAYLLKQAFAQTRSPCAVRAAEEESHDETGRCF